MFGMGVSQNLVAILGAFGAVTVEDALPERFEQRAGQHAIVVSARGAGNGTQVEAGPAEPVQLVQAQPMALAVQTELAGDIGRDRERVAGIIGRRVRDGCDQGADIAARVDAGGDHDGAGSILGALVGAGVLFVAPEETVADDETRPRRRERHLGSAAYWGSTPYRAAAMSASVSSSSSPTLRTWRSRAWSRR